MQVSLFSYTVKGLLKREQATLIECNEKILVWHLNNNNALHIIEM